MLREGKKLENPQNAEFKSIEKCDKERITMDIDTFKATVGDHIFSKLKNRELDFECNSSILLNIFDFFHRDNSEDEIISIPEEKTGNATNLEQSNIIIEYEDEMLQKEIEEFVFTERPIVTTESTEVKSTVSLENILLWPDTPKRKNVRNTEKLPYVITSTEWKNLVSEKKEKKETELRLKEERKKERENKKKIKENNLKPGKKVLM